MKLAWLLLFLIPVMPAQDERTLRWNQFAHDCNEFLHTVNVNPDYQAKQKLKLKAEWEAVYPLL